MTVSKSKLLMAVYDQIEFNGRALRAAEALAGDYEVTVISLASKKDYINPKFRLLSIVLPRIRGLKVACLFWFWFRMIMIAAWERPAIVYSHNFFLTLGGWLAARAARARFVYDAHELMILAPNIPLACGERSSYSRFFYSLERWTIHRADLVIAANRERAQLMKEHYALAEFPTVIGNIPAENTMPLYSLEDVIKQYPRLRRSGRLRLIYQGDMSLLRGIGFFVRAVETIADRCELLLIGGGCDLPAIQNMIDRSPVRYAFIVLGRIPQAVLSSITVTGDIGIVTYPSDGLNNIYCASNKIHEYAQSGLPVLATDQPPLRAAVEQYGIGLTITAGEKDPAVAAARILELVDHLDLHRQALKRFCDDHRWADETKRLISAVKGPLVPPTLRSPRAAA